MFTRLHTTTCLGPFLQGVYVPAAGKLMAVAEPAQPLRLPASLSLYPRWGLGEQDSGGDGSGSTAHGGLGVHTALLEARTRRRWGTGGDEAAEAAEQQAGRYRNQASWQRCSFVLDLVMAQPVAPDAADPVQPLRHKVGRSGSGGRRDVAASHSGSPVPGQADSGQGDGHDADSSGGWEAGREASAPSALLHGALSSRECGIRLALALAPIKVDEYYSKAVSGLPWMFGN